MHLCMHILCVCLYQCHFKRVLLHLCSLPFLSLYSILEGGDCQEIRELLTRAPGQIKSQTVSVSGVVLTGLI